MIDLRTPRKRTWKEELAAGQPRSAVRSYVALRSGSACYSYWHLRDTVERDVLEPLACRFVSDHSLNVEWASLIPGLGVWLKDVIDHLGHVQFERPYETWQCERRRWHVGREIALQTIDTRKEQLRAWGLIGVAARKAKLAHDVTYARELYQTGVQDPEIAEAMHVSLRTVRRWLREDRPRRDLLRQEAVHLSQMPKPFSHGYIARRLGVSTKTVQRWLKAAREENPYLNKPWSGPEPWLRDGSTDTEPALSEPWLDAPDSYS